MGVTLAFTYVLWVMSLETRVFEMVVSSGTTSDAVYFMRGTKPVELYCLPSCDGDHFSL